MNCKEQIYDLITEIVAYPDEAISFNKPLQVFQKYISASDYSVDESAGIKIPMTKKSAKLKETSKDELQGTEYTVSITWNADRIDVADYDKLHELKKEFKHLIIKTFGDNSMLVRSVKDGYLFTMDDNEGSIECELSIMNTCGVQRIL